jgi:hypothetical protein
MGMTTAIAIIVALLLPLWFNVAYELLNERKRKNREIK